MTLIIRKSCFSWLKMLPLVLMLLAGSALAGDGTILSADELKSLIKGATRAGKFPGGTYYLTFQDDGSYCLRVNAKEGDCVEKGPWWFEGNTVCRKSAGSGEYCWNATKLADNRFRSEIKRVKSSKLEVGRKREFWIE